MKTILDHTFAFTLGAILTIILFILGAFFWGALQAFKEADDLADSFTDRTTSVTHSSNTHKR